LEPLADEGPPASAPRATKSALAFFGVLLALFPLAMLAQYAHPVAGLAATQLCAFLLPAVVATAGSNLRLAPYLRLAAPRPSVLALGTLAGGAGFLVAGAVTTLAQKVLPARWVEATDLSRFFEGGPWATAAFVAVAAGLAPACEEITFRGYLQTTLALRRGPRAAIAGSAFLFAILHLDPVRFPALLVLGTAFAWMTWWTGSVWPAVAAHATNNGLSAAAFLAAGTPKEPAPPAWAVLPVLALGASALVLLLLALRAAARAPSAPAEAVVLRDPASPSIAFSLARVPPPIRLLALAGAATLAALAALGLALARGGGGS
jgi:membrane protease YdiL (CAAX protease family)